MKVSNQRIFSIAVVLAFLFALMWYFTHSTENFFTTPSDKKLIYFYSSSCKYCHSFDPIWNLFIRNVDSSCIQFYKINVDNNRGYFSNYHVKGVPAVVATTGSYTLAMPGPKTYENLINFFTQFRAI